MFLNEFTWWLRSRRIHTALPIAFIVYPVLLALTGDHTGALSSAAQVGVALAAPIPVVATMLYCLTSPAPHLEEAGYRRHRLYDVTVLSACVGVACLMGAATGWVAASSSAFAAGRNVAFLAGLALATRVFIGVGSSVVPVAWLITVFLTGPFMPEKVRAWTVIPEPVSSAHALTVSAGLFALGCFMHLTSRKVIS
ncbi:hypothetical protein [Streptomyces sp. NPDC056982]|uniref:hypothetical protein n=1 Tax=Streptomyces sp. NPDC056982 TaxID=3345986 RepID=UPI00364387E9